MFRAPVKFYFIKTGAHAPLTKDLATIADQLGTYDSDGVKLTLAEKSLLISYPESSIKAVLSIDDASKYSDIAISSQLLLTCEKTDAITVNLLRNIVRSMNYRVFNPKLGCYMAQDPDLLDLTTMKIDKKVSKLMTDNGLDPLFNYRNNLVYFARKKDGKAIYQTNSDLLLSLTENGEAKYLKSDFAVKVASDLGAFIALYDKGMIQGSFYSKRETLFNYSDIKIVPLERDVFVRPIFFKYQTDTQKFVQHKGHVMRRDFLKKGSRLKTYPERTIKSLKVKGKYLAAKISRKIDYEKNDKNKLIPRLNLVIFIK